MIAGVADLVVDLKALVGADPHRSEIELQPARVTMVAVEVDDDEDHVLVAVALAEAEQLIVVGLVKDEARVVVQRGVLAADPVQARDDLAQAVLTFEVPGPELELLVVDVLLRPRTR